jgi:hypothetical protein
VEQAGKPVHKRIIDKAATSHIAPFWLNRLSGLFHNKIHLLWNRPESLFIKGLLTRLQPLISFPVASE